MEKKATTLSGREKLFCEQYIICYNQTEAAKRAGYPAKSAAKRGCELMKRADVKAYVLQLQQERSERLCVSADFVLAETLDLLQRCKAAEPVQRWSYETHRMEDTGEYTLDVKGACRCLELLAKMTGADERLTGTEDGPVFYKDDMPEEA